jgi:hypothetical protein
MGASTVAVGIEGGEEFATAADLRPSETLILLIDAAEDVPGAFGRRQNDVRAALDGDGALVLLAGPRIADGLATQFGCWIRAKVGLDILPGISPARLPRVARRTLRSSSSGKRHRVPKQSPAPKAVTLPASATAAAAPRSSWLRWTPSSAFRNCSSAKAFRVLGTGGSGSSVVPTVQCS